MPETCFDFVVVGAGCFGAWTAHALVRAGHKVLLLDAHGPAHSRASSGGESRVIRMGYGPDELYTRWSVRSLAAWKALAARSRRPLFRQTGMLWLAGAGSDYVVETERTLARAGVPQEHLTASELSRRFPQISTSGIDCALWEPGSGALMARQAVQTLVAESIAEGLNYRTAAIAVADETAAGTTMDRIVTRDGTQYSAARYVFACGAWLPKLFPRLLGSRIFPTRQEIFFFATPPGDDAFSAPAMPAWFHHPALVYGIPDLDHRGFKISVDEHGPAIDPDREDRAPGADALARARAYLAIRFPKLAGAALAESRVCQYENTANGDFIIDRHPAFDNVFIAGGGSGHGFKHGPAVGDYAARLALAGAGDEPRFAVAGKATTQRRSVY
ncbi:MAG: FAD-dependent oxidoreductase [Rudaea sp.]